jgi:methionyl aminopeptidase
MKTQVKTAAEIEAMRYGGKILGQTLQALKAKTIPGMKTQQIDALARELLAEQGVEPAFLGFDGFPASICISVNEEIVHGLPGDRVLHDGDLVKFDFGVKHEGMITDSAISFILGSSTNPKAEKLIKATEEALSRAINSLHDGVRVGDIGAVIGSTIQKHGFYVLQTLGGHGVGHRLHEDPWIGNDGVAGTGQTLKAGMTIALEPIASIGTEDLVMADDGWTCITDDGSLAAQSEHTILITESGAEILTLP